MVDEMNLLGLAFTPGRGKCSGENTTKTKAQMERSVTHVSGTDKRSIGGGGRTRTYDLRIMRPSL
jgi:hypothetical protein